MIQNKTYAPDGGLDQDTDIERLDPSDYTEALNVTHITNSTRSTRAIIPILGNTYAFQIAPVTAQNKEYKVTGFSGDNTSTHDLLFYSMNGFNWTTITFTEGATVAASIANLQTALTAGLPGTPNYTVGPDYLIFDINIIPGYNYLCTCTTLTVVCVQEGYSLSLTGEMHPIGSWDLLGDLFIWSTPQTKMPFSPRLTITNVVNNGFGRFRVTTSTAHGLTTNEMVVISGVLGTTGVNGTWLITVISPTVFDCDELYANFAGVYVSSPDSLITLYTQGVGEIGVATKNADTNTWVYRRLLRSSQWNFRTKKQPKTYGERNNEKSSLYWTDDNEPPRVFYYSGAYVTDGAIAALNPLGRYDYDTVAVETRLMLDALGSFLEFENQAQAGGGVLSGNWRYSFRLITAEGGAGTPYAVLSNPVIVYSVSETQAPNSVYGNPSGIITSKINNLSISGIPPGIFAFVELVGVNYIDGGAVTGYIIKRQAIPESSTDILISHTGREIGVEEFDLGLLPDPGVYYTKAKNISAQQGRMILSNIEQQIDKDLTGFAGQITHALLRTKLTNPQYSSTQDVYHRVGYMYNETYRFGIRVKWRTGGISKVYWIDDIRFDTNPTTPDGRRTAGLPSYDLTDNTATNSDVYSAYVQFGNIDLSYTVAGVSIRDLIEYFEIMRVECIPEILASGIAVIGVTDFSTSTLSDGSVVYPLIFPTLYVVEYPFATRNDVGTAIPYPGGMTAKRRYAAFYAPDIMFGNTAISFLPGDKVYCFGNPANTTVTSQPIPGDNYNSVFNEYNGYNNVTTFQPAIPILDVALVDDAGNHVFVGDTVLKEIGANNGGPQNEWINYRSPMIQLPITSTFDNNITNTDYGLYNIQYFRAITDKYGEKEKSIYIYTGARYTAITGSTTIVTQDVFGGDVFTQESFLINRFQSGSPIYGFDNLGWNGSVSYYSQNRVNAQMAQKDTGPTMWRYPTLPVVTWLDVTYLSAGLPLYNTGYNIRNGIQDFIAFDSRRDTAFDLPTRIIYSEVKPQNSPQDQYRVYLPLNFKDLDPSFGEIEHHDVGNGELLTWQQRQMQRQYFEPTAVLTSTDGQAATFGSAAVLSRTPQTLTTIGTEHGFSVIKGRSAQGNDVFYWLNTELKKAMRLGFDGTVAISEIHGMRSFIANNTQWVADKDTPADGAGICGYWDDRKMEAGWTVRGARDESAWGGALVYAAGDVVFYQPSVYSTYEQTGELYVSLTSGNVGNQPDISPGDWQLIPHTDNNYYNEYTLIFNGIKNKFTSFYTPKAKLYLKWTDTFLSFSPRIANPNEAFEHNLGEYCVWYDHTEPAQVEDGYLEGQINEGSIYIKKYAALAVDSEIVPYRFDFTTKTQLSFLTQGEFETREDGHYAPIKEDSTVTGLNDANTSSLFGRYIKARMTFQSRTYQKLVTFTVKFRVMARRVET